MQSKLIIKNFGPIDNATLNFKSVNIIIGAQASGKSTIAKLFTICNSPKSYHLLPEDERRISFFSLTKNKRDLEIFQKLSIDKFKDSLNIYSLEGCYSKKTEIIYDCPTHYLEIKNDKILFKDKLDLNNILELEDKKKYKEVEKEFDKLAKLSDRFDLLYKFSVMWSRMSSEEKFKLENEDLHDKFDEFSKDFNKSDKNLTDTEIYSIIEQARKTKVEIFYNSPLYIPSERVLVHLLKKAALNLQRYDIPIPEHLLNFASVYNSATEAIKNYDLNFINNNTLYKNVNGEDRIYYSSRKSIKLSESASGFQSILPILLSIKYEKEKTKRLNYSFVIEEPETNLFPKAQYDLLKILESGRLDDYGKIDKGSMHLYTTHSPFILSSINNLLFAHKKGNDNNQKFFENINKIIDSKSWINPNDFSAYQVSSGKVKSIFNSETGLIEQNMIDMVSENIINDFREIALSSME
ncbi:hypothetical protein DBR39_19575 [Chryseobacterium sp. KBW03]|uniref:AAA family ATPase n=1 Tax=Chryseobacterium sp. KBW03 TaxID=2153362 RepID=UPI000F5AFD2F|nr:AAA family ATPase [Chryseobacterium sp. KBW03]RQO35164.1 hypothetical protein DBR39_19575 [Chryseobacterium sp. KBW03]